MSKIRMTLDLVPQLHEKLTYVTEVTGATSKAEALRKALLIYEFIIQRLKNGDDFLIVSKDGETKSLEFPGVI